MHWYPISMEESDYYLGLSLTRGIGRTRLLQLLDFFGTAENAWKATEGELRNAGLRGKIRKQFLENRRKIDINSYKQFLSSKNIDFISIIDKRYPHKLIQTNDFPIILFVKGETSILNMTPMISVVGTRKMTHYGTVVTKLLVKDLVIEGFVIVSGLALGVDAQAHKTALENNGKTIAVLGCGVECCKPSQNQRIYNEILEKGGVVISEYPPGTQPSKGTFPARNRIIAGISDGVLVTEAGLSSGSLITAEYAKSFEKKVFAVPGPITSYGSIGCNSLLKKGAILVQDGNDILKTFDHSTHLIRLQEDILKDDFEKKIFKIVEKETISVDDLSKRLKIPIRDLMAKLSTFEIEGVITIKNGVVSLV